MIEIKNKDNCCGCHACSQACPKQCITLREDEEGFLYPQVDVDICIDCHLCEKVCPVINKNEPREPLTCYAAKNPDETIRMTSSSGGVFTMLAENVIDEGGVVFGAGFNSKWQVVHSFTESKEGVSVFRGSKYVQSVIGNTYKEAEEFLKKGRKVLFSGTPCQIAGLKKYLRKDYGNLLTVDFICHGVPSPGVFRWYLREEIEKYADQKGGRKNTVSLPLTHIIPEGNAFVGESPIKHISFRDKRLGWKKYSFALSLAEASADGKQNTVSLSYPADENSFMKGFFRDIYLRPSCYSCPVKPFKSGADLTIADFWRIERIHPELDDDKGVSAVLVNTSQGKIVLDKYANWIVPCDLSFIEKYNSALYKSPTCPKERKKFYECFGTTDFERVINDLCRTTITQILKSKIKGVILRIRK